jgi:osomolarity two-component system sensor histidine kinase NIK1
MSDLTGSSSVSLLSPSTSNAVQPQPATGGTAEPLSPDNMTRPLASAAPIHSFPVFLLSLLTALESDPSSVAHHLANLAASHAAPATFEASPQGKPKETDAIVASLSRIADRLQKVEGEATVSENGEEEDGKLASGLAAVGLSPDPSEDDVPAPEQPVSSAAEKLRRTSPRRPIVAGSNVEEVRQNCENQIQALKVLHAEELHRAQLSHDNEVR